MCLPKRGFEKVYRHHARELISWYNMVLQGITINSGSEPKLEPGGSRVVGNTITNFSLVVRTVRYPQSLILIALKVLFCGAFKVRVPRFQGLMCNTY